MVIYLCCFAFKFGSFLLSFAFSIKLYGDKSQERGKLHNYPLLRAIWLGFSTLAWFCVSPRWLAFVGYQSFRTHGRLVNFLGTNRPKLAECGYETSKPGYESSGYETTMGTKRLDTHETTPLSFFFSLYLRHLVFVFCLFVYFLSLFLLVSWFAKRSVIICVIN